MKKFFASVRARFAALSASAVALFSGAVSATTAPAPIDVAGVTGTIDANIASVSSIGMAVLAVLAIVVVFSLIRRVMSGR